MLSGSSVGSVIRTANLLQVGAVEKAACDYFVKSLEPSTCDALSFATAFSECGAHARELHARCMSYTVECSQEASFVELPHEAVAELIASDDLPKEEAVVAAVRRWFEHDAKGRAACPRLKRRKGSVQPVLPLAFTAFARGCNSVSEDGALLTSTEDPVDHAAICGERVMNSGQSCAEFTVVGMSSEVPIR